MSDGLDEEQIKDIGKGILLCASLILSIAILYILLFDLDAFIEGIKKASK